MIAPAPQLAASRSSRDPARWAPARRRRRPGRRRCRAPAAARTVAAKELPAELDRIFRRADLRADAVGDGAVAGLGRDAVPRNAGKLMMPASNMKIVTLAAAAERLGWDYTWNDPLLGGGADRGAASSAATSSSSGAAIRPSTRAAAARIGVFERWADLLSAAGIRTHRGPHHRRRAGVRRRGARRGLGVGRPGSDYAAPVGALQFNEDAREACGAAGAGRRRSPATCEVGRPRAAWSLDNRGRDRRRRAAPRSACVACRGATVLDGHRADPRAPSQVVRTSRAWTARRGYFARALRGALVARGIEVTGPPLDYERADVPPVRRRPRRLFVHQSPPLAEAARSLMKVSQNLYAETLLKTLGAGAGRRQRGGRAEGRAASVSRCWGVAARGVRSRRRLGAVALQLRDGRDARHGAAADVSRRAAPEAFLATLPVGGQDGGTIARRFKGTPRGRQRPGEDRIDHERAGLSGYVDVGGRRAAGLLDPREQLHPAAGDDRRRHGPRGRAPRRGYKRDSGPSRPRPAAP